MEKNRYRIKVPGIHGAGCIRRVERVAGVEKAWMGYPIHAFSTPATRSTLRMHPAPWIPGTLMRYRFFSMPPG